jgi:hypothetical protein
LIDWWLTPTLAVFYVYAQVWFLDLYTSTDGYDKEELKLSFKEAVGSLSKQEIQSEIQEHFDKYVRKLQM